jgi:hypothetical protein
MNSTEIFQLGLGLVSPFKVISVELQTDSENRKSLHLSIDFEWGSKFLDEQGILCPVYDTVERTWRHLNFFEHECYLHCRVPRITSSGGKVRQISVPWVREGSGFTLLFEAFSMHLIESEMPVNKVGETLSEYHVWRNLHFIIVSAVF